MPLQPTSTTLNNYTIFLNSPTGTVSLNSAYTVPSSEQTLGHIMTCCKYRPDLVGAINNVYNLPIIEPAIHYLHGDAVFPTKSTWLNAIRNRNYLTWPLINVKNMNKFFPESEETQKGHMCTQHQGVASNFFSHGSVRMIHQGHDTASGPTKCCSNWRLTSK